MKAMVLKNICDLRENKKPLEMVNLPDPVPGEREILVKISACGVCHIELDEIEGRTPPPRLPVVLGHQVVGKVEKVGSGAKIPIIPEVQEFALEEANTALLELKEKKYGVPRC